MFRLAPKVTGVAAGGLISYGPEIRSTCTGKRPVTSTASLKLRARGPRTLMPARRRKRLEVRMLSYRAAARRRCECQ